jgi:hypothetical protein
MSRLMGQFNPMNLTQYGLIPLNYFKNYQDPTAFDMPYMAPNPESAFFATLERYRFRDGGAFDFRGSGTLGNSNERTWKGFKATFRFGRAYRGIGQYKLDWILVKPFIVHPRLPQQSLRMAPHNPETMAELSRLISTDVSDHAPLTVDLPLLEP